MGKFKVGDYIRYGMFIGVSITGEDEKHFILMDKNGNTKKVYKELVEGHSEYMEDYRKRKLTPNEKTINAISREVKGVLMKENINTKVTLHDLRGLVIAFYTDEFELVQLTKLFLKYTNEYNLALIYLEKKYGEDRRNKYGKVCG